MEGNEDPIYRNRRLARERKDRWKLCQSQETLIVYVLCKRRRYKSGSAIGGERHCDVTLPSYQVY